MEKFIDDYFLGQITVYSLFGSKPMTEIPVCCASKEEWASNYAKLVEQEYPKEEQEESLAEFDAYLEQYDLPENWEKWLEWWSKHLNRSFLFSKRPTFSDSVFSLFILNVQEAAWTLQHYYSSISRELAMEFDPLEVVMQFEDLSSPFWAKVFQSHYVQGLLHGFGERNAFFFDRSMKVQSLEGSYSSPEALFKSSIIDNKERKGLPTPPFRSYLENQENDPVYQHFSGEKGRISRLLAHKSRYELILERLGYMKSAQQTRQSNYR